MDSSEKIIAATHRALLELGVTEDSSLLLGVSGGIDSVSLAFVLHELWNRKLVQSLELLHVNHHLRGEESELDETFVRQLAAELGLPLEVASSATRARHEATHESIELAARNERYRLFAESVARKKITHLITAHTADDQVETVLMNLLRGTGIRGLGGIPASRTLRPILDEAIIIRPWLAIWRSELVEFALKNQIHFREDSTNASLAFTRNRVRHGLIPYLEEQFPERDIRRAIHAMSQVMRREATVIETLAAKSFGTLQRMLPLTLLPRHAVGIDLKGLVATESGLWHDIIQCAFSKLDLDARTLSSIHTKAVEQFLNSTQQRLELSGNMLLQKEGELLVIERREASQAFVGREIDLANDVDIETEVGQIRITVLENCTISKHPNIAYFDCEHIFKQGLTIRGWSTADRMHPFGMRGSKLVSDLLNEAGVRTETVKRRIPVITATKSREILWIPGVRASECYKVTEATTRVLKMERIPA